MKAFLNFSLMNEGTKCENSYLPSVFCIDGEANLELGVSLCSLKILVIDVNILCFLI